MNEKKINLLEVLNEESARKTFLRDVEKTVRKKLVDYVEGYLNDVKGHEKQREILDTYDWNCLARTTHIKTLQEFLTCMQDDYSTVTFLSEKSFELEMKLLGVNIRLYVSKILDQYFIENKNINTYEIMYLDTEYLEQKKIEDIHKRIGATAKKRM